MTRSPLFYPLNRGMDAEAGGAADLQTDVMRFMAIISLCLVAIFALVQTIPLAPAPPVIEAPPAVAEVATPATPQTAPEREITLIRPEPVKMKKAEETVALNRPLARPLEKVAEVEPTEVSMPPPVLQSTMPEPRTSREAQDGFTLRFESDSALTRLVARDVVGLYAMSMDKTHRMTVDSGDIGFWTASTPQKIHEMDVTTVPAPVLNAYRRSSASGANGIKWGVSIPAAMSRQLDQYLSEQPGGSLIIGADGALRLEQ